jgi:hypothetical protein
LKCKKKRTCNCMLITLRAEGEGRKEAWYSWKCSGYEQGTFLLTMSRKCLDSVFFSRSAWLQAFLAKEWHASVSADRRRRKEIIKMVAKKSKHPASTWRAGDTGGWVAGSEN